MSHMTNVSTEIRDLESLKKACDEMGYELIIGQTTYKWFGRWVGDTELPPGVKIEDLGKCDHAIRVPGAKYEIGVVRVGDHYELRYDYWGPGGLSESLGGKIAQKYAVEKVKKMARKKRRSYKESVMNDGTVKMVIKV